VIIEALSQWGAERAPEGPKWGGREWVERALQKTYRNLTVLITIDLGKFSTACSQISWAKTT
jgi:hypothetical protein